MAFSKWVDAKGSGPRPYATKVAEKSTATVTGWKDATPAMRAWGHAKASEKHIEAAKKAMAAGNHSLAEHHINQANEHSAASLKAADERDASKGGGGGGDQPRDSKGQFATLH